MEIRTSDNNIAEVVDKRFRKEYHSISNIIKDRDMFNEKKDDIKLLRNEIKKKAKNEIQIKNANVALELLMAMGVSQQNNLHIACMRIKQLLQETACVCVCAGVCVCGVLAKIGDQQSNLSFACESFQAIRHFCENIQKDIQILRKRLVNLIKKENIKNGDFSEWGVH